MTAAISERAACLRRAEELTTGPREAEYGDMVETMRRVAYFWSTYLDQTIDAAQVCHCMALLKIARTVNNPCHMDSHDDAAAYIAMALECAKAGA